jgi:hypothetical protein
MAQQHLFNIQEASGQKQKSRLPRVIAPNGSDKRELMTTTKVTSGTELNPRPNGHDGRIPSSQQNGDDHRHHQRDAVENENNWPG